MVNDETAWHASKMMMTERSVPEDMQEDLQKNVIGWGRRAARAIGCSSPTQQKESENEIVRIFAALDEHLKTHKFVFGDVPTAVDAVLMGGLRAHFLNDIYPKSLLEPYPNVQKWHDDWDQTKISAEDETLHGLTATNLPPFVALILNEMGGGFRDFVLGMKRAAEEGTKAAVVRYETLLVVPALLILGVSCYTCYLLLCLTCCLSAECMARMYHISTGLTLKRAGECSLKS
jgi:hypothetical protein